MKPISFIQPSRNNLKYLKWSYNSIRKNLGYIHEICWADDFSDDGNKLSDEIERLNQLLNDGILTQEEFEKAKKKLLDN